MKSMASGLDMSRLDRTTRDVAPGEIIGE